MVMRRFAFLCLSSGDPMDPYAGDRPMARRSAIVGMVRLPGARASPVASRARRPGGMPHPRCGCVPELFSCMQGVIEGRNEPGQYVLSGSRNFLLPRSISRSHAGRVAILHLLPLSYAEMSAAGVTPDSMGEFLFAGGYPRLRTMGVDPGISSPTTPVPTSIGMCAKSLASGRWPNSTRS